MYITCMRTNHETNKTFLNAIDAKTRGEIIQSIALHYGASQADILDEVTTEGAEHLLDYLTGSVRSAAHVLMQRHGLAA
jgi:hypothetical protein